MFAVDRGRPQRDYHHNWLHCVLPAPLSTKKDLDVTLRAYDRFNDTAVLHLEMEVEHLQADDEISVGLNGVPVTSWRRSGVNRLVAKVPAAQLHYGKNLVVMQLVKQSARSSAPRTVTAFELHVSRPSESRPQNYASHRQRRASMPAYEDSHSAHRTEVVVLPPAMPIAGQICSVENLGNER